MRFSQRTIEAAATAIANIRSGRRGAPPISNVLDVLRSMQVGGRASLYDEVMEDARAALEAAANDIEAERTEVVQEPQQSCNRHIDCSQKPADSDCCHDECCEDCFGR